MITTLLFYPDNSPRWRYFALWYFTTLLIVWNILGHTVLRFENSHGEPLVGLATAITVQILLEWVDARAHRRPTRYSGGWKSFANFLPPAIIPGLAVPMLFLCSNLLWPIVFATTLAIASKVLIRVPVGNGRWQHLFNPSNFGITVAYLLFPWVAAAHGYHFTGNVTGWANWTIPGVAFITLCVVSLGRGLILYGVAAWNAYASVRAEPAPVAEVA